MPICEKPAEVLSEPGLCPACGLPEGATTRE